MNQSSENWHYKEAVYYGILFLISFGLIVGSYYLDRDNYKLFSHLTGEVGIAGLIACALAITIERLSKEKWGKLAAEERETIRRDIFLSIYNRRLPAEITKELETQILSSKFAQRNLSIHYTIEPIRNKNERRRYVLVTLTLDFDIQNLTMEPQEFDFKPHIEKSHSQRLTQEAKFIKLQAKNCESPINLIGEELTERQRPDGWIINLDVDRKIVVLPGKEAQITMSSQTVKHLDGGADYLVLLNHTCKLDLTVQVNEGIKVYAKALTDEKLREIGHDPKRGYYHWKLERPLLSNQGIIVAWEPE